jgi:L-amino acid N-acyltransferase YncA
MIRPATTDDASQICAIYNHYVAHTPITFEERPVTPEEMTQQIAEVMEALPWLVGEEDGKVLGFAYASKWKGRCAYRYSVESTVYLDPTATGKGFGSQLYQLLFNELRQRGMHTALAGISLPNVASVALHEKFGFQKVAHFKEVGRKFEQWIDLGYWQLFL